MNRCRVKPLTSSDSILRISSTEREGERKIVERMCCQKERLFDVLQRLNSSRYRVFENVFSGA
jgi:hypothetical protein